MLVIVVLAVLMSGCSKKPVVNAKSEETKPIQVTVWTGKGELFLEYPPLVVSERGRFAVHLTRLDNFKPLREGKCEVRLEYGASSAEVFSCDASVRPGIFGVNVQPKHAGTTRMTIRVNGSELTEQFDVGPVQIATDIESAQTPSEHANEETIAFLKEQQWSLDFGTQPVSQQTVRDSLRVAAETLPRTGGEARVIAPISGRLIVDRTYSIGTTVQKGTELASIVPPTASASDLAALQLAEAEAKAALEFSQKDHQRVERLLSAGAVPARRVDEAKLSEANAKARLEAAESRLAQYQTTRTAEGTDVRAQRFLLRAPISGVLAEANATSGANVEIGSVLFRIVNLDTLFISGVVPESELSRLRKLSGAEIEMPDTDEVRAAHSLVSVGKLVDPATRTVDVVYGVDNGDHRLAVNQTVFMRLLLAPGSKTPVVPESAIVDDGGRPIVFVQKTGESFARRPVKLGIRAGGVVQVLEGVKTNERVVTKGAYLIRLAAMSSQIPAHGHVH
jgi:RND family efflux transporter MFP subunit